MRFSNGRPSPPPSKVGWAAASVAVGGATASTESSGAGASKAAANVLDACNKVREGGRAGVDVSEWTGGKSAEGPLTHRVASKRRRAATLAVFTGALAALVGTLVAMLAHAHFSRFGRFDLTINARRSRNNGGNSRGRANESEAVKSLARLGIRGYRRLQGDRPPRRLLRKEHVVVRARARRYKRGAT